MTVDMVNIEKDAKKYVENPTSLCVYAYCRDRKDPRTEIVIRRAAAMKMTMK